MKNSLILKKNIIKTFYLIVTFLFFANLSFAQFEIPSKPEFQTSVYDYAQILSETEKSKLETKLVKYSDSTTTQIVFISIESLKGENIGLLAPKWAHTWGIGQAKEDNGIIILLAKKERKIWISPGYGVEERLTAGITGDIIRNIIIPEFKSGNYYTGINQGVDAIFKVLKGKYKGERKKNESDLDLGVLLFFVFLILLLIIIFRNKGNHNNRGGFGKGLDIGDIIILSSMGRGGSGWSSGGGDSGGFGGGFGGGGFSGGGAGGDW